MLKQLLVASVMGFMLTGCVVGPYDDHPRGQYHDNRDYKMRGEGRYKNADKREWNNSDRRYEHRKGDYRR
jgi:hypothetical protein